MMRRRLAVLCDMCFATAFVTRDAASSHGAALVGGAPRRPSTREAALSHDLALIGGAPRCVLCDGPLPGRHRCMVRY